MKELSEQLRGGVVEATQPRFAKYRGGDVSLRIARRLVSQQVVGHLIDSASNNHQRFVRSLLQPSLDFPGYDHGRKCACTSG